MDSSSPGSSIHRDSPGKNTRVGCNAFPQGIFLTQETNWGLLHCMQILYQLSYQGSPQVMPDLLNSPWDGKGKPRLPVYRGSGSSLEKQNLKVQGLQFGIKSVVTTTGFQS